MTEYDLPVGVGDIIKERYKIVRIISQGQRGALFCAVDTQMQQIAIKFEQESDEQTAVSVEAAILKILDGQNHIPQFILYGVHLNCKFLAMELMGPSLIELVNYKRPFKFKLNSILKFGVQAIEALQVVHNKGIVHRDIKPGNFLIGNSHDTKGIIKLTDFELCKKIHKVDGIITKPTNKGCFRGTLMYASLNAHNNVELGRNDDLISLLYILVEFHNGMLPWSDIDDIKQIEQLKFNYHGHKLLKWLPKQFLQFESYIISLDYTSDPDYAFLTSLLEQAAEENKIDLNDPFEWEEEMNNERNQIIKHQFKKVQKIDNIIKELEKQKKKIQEENNKYNLEKIEQLDNEINNQQEQSPSQYQLEVKLNSINLVHQLQKKYDYIYKQEEEKEDDDQEEEENRDTINKIHIQYFPSHIHAVKSYNRNNELFDQSTIKDVSYSPLSPPLKMSPLSNMNNQYEQPKYLSRSSSHLSRLGISTQTNTVQELAAIIDALVDSNQNADQTTIESILQVEGTQQESQINNSEQFLDEMKHSENKSLGINWDQFIGSVGGSRENELFEFQDIMSNDIISFGSTSPLINEQQQQQQSQSSNKTNNVRNNHELQLQKSLQSSPQQNSITQLTPDYSPQIQTHKQQSPKNSPIIISPSDKSPIERQLSPLLLESQVRPITKVIHNQPGQTRTHKTLIANMKVNNQPQILFQKSLQELESIPATPMGQQLSEEIKQWNLSSEIKKRTPRNLKQQTDVQNNKEIDFQDNEGLFLKGSQNCNDINKLKNHIKQKYVINTSSLSKQDKDQEQDDNEEEEIDDEYDKNRNQDLNNKITKLNQNDDQMRLSAKVLQPLLITGNSNEIQNKNEIQINKQQIDNNIQSPFSIPQSKYIDNANTIPTLDNQDNTLQIPLHIDCDLQEDQSLQYISNLNSSQYFSIQPQSQSPLPHLNNITPLLSQNYQQFSQNHQDDIYFNSTSNPQLVINTSSNNLITPKSYMNEKHSPLAVNHNAWEIEDGNENKQQQEKEQDYQQGQQKLQEKQQEQIKNKGKEQNYKKEQEKEQQKQQQEEQEQEKEQNNEQEQEQMKQQEQKQEYEKEQEQQKEQVKEQELEKEQEQEKYRNKEQEIEQEKVLEYEKENKQKLEQEQLVEQQKEEELKQQQEKDLNNEYNSIPMLKMNDMIIDQNQDLSNLNSHTNHNIQSLFRSDNADIELSIKNDKSCCTIL